MKETANRHSQTCKCEGRQSLDLREKVDAMPAGWILSLGD